MLISHRHKFIFFHIYKVAGTSISSALRNYSVYPEENLSTVLLQKAKVLPKGCHYNDHITPRELKEKISPKIFDKYFKFAFVRNPWDWQVSLYVYILKKQDHKLHSLVKALGSFENYMAWRTSQPPKLRRFQKNYLTDEDDNLLVDYVGRYENLNKDFNSVLAQLKIDAELPHLNKNNTKQYLAYYNSKSTNLFSKYYKEDINFLGYSNPFQDC